MVLVKTPPSACPLETLRRAAITAKRTCQSGEPAAQSSFYPSCPNRRSITCKSHFFTYFGCWLLGPARKCTRAPVLRGARRAASKRADRGTGRRNHIG